MRCLAVSINTVVLAAFISAAPAEAGPKGKAVAPQGGAKAPKAPIAKGPKTHVANRAPKSQGPATKAKTTTIKSAPKPKTVAALKTTHKTTTVVPASYLASPAGNKLATNSAMRSKIEARLDALGYPGTVYEAAYGFRNFGQFNAATNVSQNLGLSFEQLKLQMTGVSVLPNGTILRANVAPDGTIILVDPAFALNPPPTRSLGQSIQIVKAGSGL